MRAWYTVVTMRTGKAFGSFVCAPSEKCTEREPAVVNGSAPVSMSTSSESTSNARPNDRQRYVSRSVMRRGSEAAMETMSLGVRKSGRASKASQPEVPKA